MYPFDLLRSLPASCYKKIYDTYKGQNKYASFRELKQISGTNTFTSVMQELHTISFSARQQLPPTEVIDMFELEKALVHYLYMRTQCKEDILVPKIDPRTIIINGKPYFTPGVRIAISDPVTGTIVKYNPPKKEKSIANEWKLNAN